MERRNESKWPEPTTPEPTHEDLRAWTFDERMPEATDGCTVEPDGVCPHGHPSWMLAVGLV